MALPTKVTQALEAELSDMINWSILLQFFSDFQNNLSLPEKISIYNKCEDFLQFWNTDREETYTMTRNSGAVVEQIKHIKSLDISRQEVYPDNIYNDKDFDKHFQKTLDNISQIIPRHEEFLLDEGMATA